MVRNSIKTVVQSGIISFLSLPSIWYVFWWTNWIHKISSETCKTFLNKRFVDVENYRVLHDNERNEIREDWYQNCTKKTLIQSHVVTGVSHYFSLKWLSSIKCNSNWIASHRKERIKERKKKRKIRWKTENGVHLKWCLIWVRALYNAQISIYRYGVWSTAYNVIHSIRLFHSFEMLSIFIAWGMMVRLLFNSHNRQKYDFFLFLFFRIQITNIVNSIIRRSMRLLLHTYSNHEYDAHNEK